MSFTSLARESGHFASRPRIGWDVFSVGTVGQSEIAVTVI